MKKTCIFLVAVFLLATAGSAFAHGCRGGYRGGGHNWRWQDGAYHCYGNGPDHGSHCRY